MDAVKGRLMDFLGHIGLDKSVFEREAGLANGFVDKTNSKDAMILGNIGFGDDNCTYKYVRLP